MKEEQKYSQQHSSYSQEILLTPTHIINQKQAYNNQLFENDKARKRLENSMSQYQQNNQADQNKKLQFLNLLLNALGYSKSAKVLESESMGEHSCRNPEKSSSKKSKKRDKKQSLNYKIEQIINQNTCFDEMLNQLSLTLKQEQQQKMIQEIVDQSQTLNLANHRHLQKAIQIMFPKKQTTTIPVYQSLQVECSGKVIRFADINSQQDLCILDNQNTLYVVQRKKRQKILQTHLSQKIQIIDMKWVNPQIMVLLSSNNKILFYDKKIENIMVMRSLKMPIIIHEICVIRNRPTSQNLYVLTASKHLLVPFKINVSGKEVIEESLPTFETEYELSALTTIKVPHRITFHRPLNTNKQQTQFNIVTEIEHFYGLTGKMRKIVKFDSIVEQSGIVWECSTQQFVIQLKTSECGHFLQMLIANSQNGTLQNCNVKKLSFIKMLGSGCIQQRLDMSLQYICKDISLRSKFMSGKSSHSSNSTRWLKLSPYWVRCFARNNFIYYVSLKTGNILLGQQIQKNEVKLLSVGNQNTLLYESNGKLIILSTQDHGKKIVTLQSRRSPDLRESLIQRFSRIHGIPENLLFLLRTIRNNEIELQEISE